LAADDDEELNGPLIPRREKTLTLSLLFPFSRDLLLDEVSGLRELLMLTFTRKFGLESEKNQRMKNFPKFCGTKAFSQGSPTK